MPPDDPKWWEKGDKVELVPSDLPGQWDRELFEEIVKEGLEDTAFKNDVLQEFYAPPSKGLELVEQVDDAPETTAEFVGFRLKPRLRLVPPSKRPTKHRLPVDNSKAVRFDQSPLFDNLPVRDREPAPKYSDYECPECGVHVDQCLCMHECERCGMPDLVCLCEVEESDE